MGSSVALIAALTAGAVLHAASHAGAAGRFDPAAWKSADLGSISPTVFGLALDAAACAVKSGATSDPSTLTVIDYSQASTKKRLWVYDLATHEVLFEELVAHGQGSGENVPTRFSNEDDTHASSIGLFVTQSPYIGKNGYSLRLQGLERGVNDHAFARDIVMHGAWYVSDDVVRTQGRLGRSWGCPAVRSSVASAIINRIKGGNLLFAYYPDQRWLASSKYLGGCAAAH